MLGSAALHILANYHSPLNAALCVKGNSVKLAVFEIDGYDLADGEERAREHPDSFFIPSLEERENLKVGDAVKLIFEMHQPNQEYDAFERMWVEITKVEDDYYVGFLDNNPEGEVSIKAGDIVVFQAKHIISIYE